MNDSSTKDAPTNLLPPRPSGLRRVFRNLERSLALLAVVMIAYEVCFMSTRIVSPSMAPTLRGNNYDNGDWVLSEKVSFWFRHPRRWEIIAFRRDDGIINMKRVVGLPGERISMQRDGTIVINGEPVPIPKSLLHLRYYPIARLYMGNEVTCDGGYFVLGDDSRDSDDSRYEILIIPERVVGRPWLIVAPRNRAGFVNASN